MITTLRAARDECAKYKDADCFCTRNCSCSILIIGGGTQAIHDAARDEAKKEGIDCYNVVSGACGDWYIVERDEMGRLI